MGIVVRVSLLFFLEVSCRVGRRAPQVKRSSDKKRCALGRKTPLVKRSSREKRCTLGRRAPQVKRSSDKGVAWSVEPLE